MKPRGDHPPGGRDIHNRLKANTVSTAGGKTPPLFHRPWRALPIRTQNSLLWRCGPWSGGIVHIIYRREENNEKQQTTFGNDA